MAFLDPLISKFGLDGHAIVGIAGNMGMTDLFEPQDVGQGLRAGRPFQPVAVAAVRNAQRPAQPAHGEFGLVRLHEFVDDMDVFSLPASFDWPANQAVAFDKMSHSS